MVKNASMAFFLTLLTILEEKTAWYQEAYLPQAANLMVK